MNKAQLIDAVATRTGLAKSDASAAVESVLTNITETLQRGGTVSLVGFGAFSVSQRSARMGRNPNSGDLISIPASRRPKFKAGKQLKDAVNSLAFPGA
ncbi:MAG TPA: HU family DNA-binding protein [Gammaproteobacteria bacterium]|nr:HU family DNA-binding protein [Gammaproteobacteria bacterium]